MTGQEFVDRLKKKFGEKITGASLDAIDPWVEVSPADLVEVCDYLRNEQDLRFDLLISEMLHFDSALRTIRRAGATAFA